MIRAFLIGLAGFSLAACGSAPEEAPAPPEPPADEALVQPEWDALDRVGADTCGMRVVRGFLGRQASEIPPERLPEVFRILAPTDQATMDYIQARLNVLTDEDGMVIGFKCG